MSMEVASVCEKCAAEYTSKRDLLREICFHPVGHEGVPRVRVEWSVDFRRLCRAAPIVERPETTTNRAVGATAASSASSPPAKAGARRVRPMPKVWFKGEFRMCQYGQQCLKADRCTFPHNKDELREWNRQKLGKQASPLPSPRSPVSSQTSPHLSPSQSPLKPSHRHPQPPSQPSPPAHRPVQTASQSPQPRAWTPGSPSFADVVKQRHASEPLSSSLQHPPVGTRASLKGTEQKKTVSPSNPKLSANRSRRSVQLKDYIPSRPTDIPHPMPRQQQSEPRRPALSLPEKLQLSDLCTQDFEKRPLKEWPDVSDDSHIFQPSPLTPQQGHLNSGASIPPDHDVLEDLPFPPVFSPTTPHTADTPSHHQIHQPPVPAPQPLSPHFPLRADADVFHPQTPPGTTFQHTHPSTPPQPQQPPAPPRHFPHSNRPLTVEIPPRRTILPQAVSQPSAVQPPVHPPQPSPSVGNPPRDYAARKLNFHERLEEPLILEDVMQELTPSNYKEKFHKLLCWEEKEHIDILESKCDGQYPLVLHQAGLKRPDWLRYDAKPEHKRLGYIKGFTKDQIAYAAQASEAVYISQRGIKVKFDILSENFHHLEERLYVAVERANIEALQKCLKVGQAGCERSVTARFELKHSYFDQLHRSLEFLSDEVIARLLPKRSSFTVCEVKKLLPKFKQSLKLDNKKEILDDKIRALEVIASCPASGPPVLISGAFGTGKTRLLALATHYFFQASSSSVRILVATQQQVSADAFLLCYARDLLIRPQQDIEISRLATRFGKKHPQLVKWYKSMSSFKREFERNSHRYQSKILVITTCQLSIHMAQFVPKGFFTHILLDEGAQTREPESIAPLSLASKHTKIVIAGDVHQVGPSMLVLGREAQEHGLAMSLLERLQRIYTDAGPAAKCYTSVLSTNYRCHRAILKLAEELFYEMPLRCQVPDDSTHPTAPYPLIFVCSSIDDSIHSVQKSMSEQEARITLQQVVNYLKSWPPHLGGPKNIGEEVCVVSSHRSQITRFSRLAGRMPYKIKDIRRHPTYDIQGREYTAVFISTSEPTEQDGSTCNPTKSICDRYVFNTTITRARSLVVAVGNPFLLLKIEEHMLKKYGEKGKCWSEFLKVCLEKGSLTIDPSVRASQQEREQCLKKLERLTKASRAATKPTPKSQTHAIPQKQSLPHQTSGYRPQSLSNPKSERQEPTSREPIAIALTSSSSGNTDPQSKLEKEYKVIDCIGKGGFGVVFHVKYKLDQQEYAVKVVRLPQRASEQRKVMKEVQALARLNHPAIVRYYHSWTDVIPVGWRSREIWACLQNSDSVSYANQSPYVTHSEDESEGDFYAAAGSPSSPSSASAQSQPSDEIADDTSDSSLVTFRDSQASCSQGGIPLQSKQGAAVLKSVNCNCLFIRTELCKKETLKNWLCDSLDNRLRRTVVQYFQQILEAVGYIHEQGLIHRDLKPSNIFFSREKEDQIKVGDFGLVTGNMAADPQGQSHSSGGSNCGTLLYMSPEQISGTRCHHPEKIDIFALGIIFFELNRPFATDHEKEQTIGKLRSNLKGRKFPPLFADRLPTEAELISCMLEEEPSKRPSAKEISERLKIIEKNVKKRRGQNKYVPSQY